MHWNDLIGRRIGSYQILSELGRGGSARVYRAHQESMHRDVAIKVLVNDSEDRMGFVRRFEREVEVVAQLSHPNIVAVYDSGEFEDLVYLVMQCVGGGTLRSRLGSPLEVGEACSGMIQMARALQHAHARGIVHRDVKPSNMLIDGEDSSRLLLTDFGIAKLAGLRGLTKSGTTIGTPEYMAPEQAEGREIDARADVYSLGCVLYEALGGRTPFAGSSPVSILYQQVHTAPDHIRALNPEIPRELARVVEVALEKRPEDRFSSAESFANALYPFTIGRDRAQFAGFGSPAANSGGRVDTASGGLDLRGSTRGGAQTTPNADEQAGADSAGQIPPREAGGPGLHGLGTEGLDALFPDDPEAQSARDPLASVGAPHERVASPQQPGSLPGAALLPDELMSPAVKRALSAGPRPTIPLAAFRLPSREAPTEPLDLPLTTEGQLDMDALMAQVDEQTTPAPAQAAWTPPPDLPRYQDWKTAADLPPYTAWEAPAHPSDYGAPQMPVPSVWGDFHATDGAIAPASHPSQMAAEYAYGMPPPIWRPDAHELALSRRRLSQRPTYRSRGVLATVVAAVLVSAIVLTWAVVSISGAAKGQHNRPPVVSTPTVQPTATATAVPSPTIAPSPTQQIVNPQAAAAFHAITLTPYEDRGCGAGGNTATFSPPQPIYVDLCIAPSAPSGSFTIVIRQGGTTVYQIVRDQYAGPSGWYAYEYNSGNLRAGGYDVLVTFNGRIAADIKFTVS